MRTIETTHPGGGDLSLEYEGDEATRRLTRIDLCTRAVGMTLMIQEAGRVRRFRYRVLPHQRRTIHCPPDMALETRRAGRVHRAWLGVSIQVGTFT